MKPRSELASSTLGTAWAASTRPASLAMLIAFVAGLALSVPVVAQNATDTDRLEWEWQLLETFEDGEATPVPPGIGITAGLYRDTISVEGACSTARGDYNAQDESLQIFPPEIEARGCDPATQAVDDAFYEGLQRVSTWQASGGCSDSEDACRPAILTLYDVVGDPVMTLTSATLPPDPGLSRWNLGRIGAADGAIGPVITGVEPWIEFQRGGHVVGSSGCGSFIGEYATNGTTLSISDVVTQAPDCTAALREQADRIIATLGDVTDFDVLPAGLVLKDEAGLTRLAFVPAIDLAGRTWTPFEVRRDGKILDDISELLSTSAVRFIGRDADGRSFCRSFRGGRLSSGLALTVSNLKRSADFSCPKPGKKAVVAPQDVEDGFLDALARTASHALRGDELVLMDVDGEPVMRLSPQADLVGPTWVVTKLETQPNSRRAKLSDPKGDEPLTARFSEPELGFLEGSTGRVAYDANYDLPRGGEIDVTDPVLAARCGRRAARTPLCVQEQLFLGLLDKANVIVIRADGSEMRLNDGERVLLRFVPEEALATEQAAEEETAPGATG